MSHYKLVVGDLGVYGRGTQEDCQRIKTMHLTVRSGAKKDTMISGKTMTIELDPGEYPFVGKSAPLGYKPG